MFVIYTKHIVICDTESLDMWLRVDEDCQFTDFSNITSL